MIAMDILSIFLNSSSNFFVEIILKKYFKCSINVLAVILASKSLFSLMEKNESGSVNGSIIQLPQKYLKYSSLNCRKNYLIFVFSGTKKCMKLYFYLFFKSFFKTLLIFQKYFFCYIHCAYMM